MFFSKLSREVSSASFYRHKKRRELSGDVTFQQCNNSTMQQENGESIGVEENGEHVEEKIPTPSQNFSTLESALKTQMVLLQAVLDLGKASLSLQEKVFKTVFGINTNTRYESMSIGELFKYAGSIGEEVEIPNSYDQLLKMYEEEGMLKPVRWRVCTRRLGSPHYPELLVPSIEDDYEGPLVVKCLCLNGPKL